MRVGILKKIKRSVKLFYKFFFTDIICTLRINAKLPLKQAIKLPIWVYGCKIDNLNGKIKIDNDSIQTGMIRLGLKTSGMCGCHNSLNISILGGMIFLGPGYLGNNSAIEVGEKGLLTMGANFGITGNFRVACRKSITIGENFSSSWGVGIYDTDFHNVISIKNGNVCNYDKAVIIGKDCWICQNSIVLKGTALPNRSILASSSLINKDFSKNEENIMYAGIPAKPIKSGITREEFIRFEKRPIGNIVNQLGL